MTLGLGSISDSIVLIFQLMHLMLLLFGSLSNLVTSHLLFIEYSARFII
jgi:hypothetical protein